MQNPAPGAKAIKNRFEQLLQTSWDQEEAHNNFIREANQKKALPWAGQLYGAVLKGDPKNQKALWAQEKILKLAFAQMEHARTSNAVKPRNINIKKWVWGGCLLILMLLVGMLFLIAQKLL